MRVLADEAEVARIIDRLADGIVRDLGAEGTTEAAFVGVRSRGDVLARRLAEKLRPAHVGVVDITLYRDDLSSAAAQPVVRTTDIPFAIDGLNIVLVDDVLMTGRSVRAALQSLMDLGRPRRVWLAVLVDRGGRELPIAADQLGLDLTGRNPKNRAASAVRPDQSVEVHLKPADEQDQVVVRDASETGQARP